MSGMDGMGMDMSSDPMFRTYNQVLARGYWYIFAAVLVGFLLLRGIEHYQTWSRLVGSFYFSTVVHQIACSRPCHGLLSGEDVPNDVFVDCDLRGSIKDL